MSLPTRTVRAARAIAALGALLTLSACQGKAPAEGPETTAEAPKAAEAHAEKPAVEKKTVAVLNLLSDPSLVEVVTAFKAEMTRLGYAEGEGIEYIDKNANGQVHLAAAMARDVVSRDPDVIVPLTTPLTQAVVKASRQPVVFAVMSTPVESGVVKTLDPPDPRVTGVLEVWPVEKQLDLMKTITPDIASVAVLFDPGSPPSLERLERIKAYAPKVGLTIIDGPITAPTEVYPVAKQSLERADALLLSIDATIARAVSSGIKAAIEAKKPAYAGVESFMRQGGIAGVSASYETIGKETATLVDKVLKGEKGLPIVAPDASAIYVNTRAAELMGVTVPQSVIDQARKVFTELEK